MNPDDVRRWQLLVHRKMLNLEIFHCRPRGDISPMVKCWTTKTTVRRGVAVGSPRYEIDRMLASTMQ
jgi:hypothetical protein